MNVFSLSVCKYRDVIKFLCVGVAASAVHAVISWIFFYHIWSNQTILSTLVGYSGGWLVSYIGNRVWSFRSQTRGLSLIHSFPKFILSQLLTMCVLITSTWIIQQLIILYFYWYIITNGMLATAELKAFSIGASYPPALVSGMGAAAIASYILMKKFVFKQR